MDFSIPEDLKQIQMLARDFIQKELLPLEKQVERTGEFPEDIRLSLKKKAFDLGLWNFAMPKEYGGGGVGTLGRILVYQELGHVSDGVGVRGGIIAASRAGAGIGPSVRRPRRRG